MASKYKIAILIHATAVGNRCHAQCRHLVKAIEKGVPARYCAAFQFQVLDSDSDGKVVRCRRCSSAQRAASRLPSKQLDLFGAQQ